MKPPLPGAWAVSCISAGSWTSSGRVREAAAARESGLEAHPQIKIIFDAIAIGESRLPLAVNETLSV